MVAIVSEPQPPASTGGPDDVVLATGGLLETVAAGAAATPILDVTFAEWDEGLPIQPGDLVLGAGLAEGPRVLELLSAAADAGAAGVVLRAALADDARAVDTARRLGITLFALRRPLSWAHLFEVLRAAVDPAVPLPTAPHGSVEGSDELFALADAIAGSLGAPVTIEDTRSRVLAYSMQEEATDTARISTIVGRRVPEDVVAHFRSRGVFRKLARSDAPVYVPGGPDGIRPRLVVPVRAAGEWLGSIWAVVDGPVDDERLAGLASVARVLALHLIRLRTQEDLARRVSREQLRAVLRRHDPSVRPGLRPPPGPWRVAALAGLPDQGADTADAAHRSEVWEAHLRRHGLRQPWVVDIDGGVFAVLPDSTDVEGRAPDLGSPAWLHTVIASSEPDGPGPRAGVGRRVDVLADLPRSRAEAAEVLELMTTDPHGPSVRTFDQSWHDVVLSRVAHAVPEPSDVAGPVPVLVAVDAERGTRYVETLGAHLAHPGEAGRAAAALGIHPNTLRHRLRRIRELVDFDADDPRQCLALRIQVEALRGYQARPRPAT